jgi:predicted MFS family arabinose efflux permease
MVAGLIFKFILERYPGIIGYGYLHLIAFFLLLISYLIFALFVKEPQLYTKKSSHSLSLYQNFKLFPRLFFGNKAFLFLVIQRLLMTARFIIFPWISIYALKILDKPTSFLGELLVWQMAGGFIGNIFSAWVGDRWSSKFVLISGRIAFLLFLSSLFIVKSKADFYLAFGLFGFSFYTMEASGFAFGLEIIPQNKRASYLSLLAFIPFPFLILSGLASNMLWRGVNSMKLICMIVATMTLLSIITLCFIPNPRKQ